MLLYESRGWSLREIAGEVHVSHETVRRILAQHHREHTELVDRLAQAISEAEVELARWGSRLKVLRRQLETEMQEQQSAAIDRVNGLA